jgi:hypothetical protein
VSTANGILARPNASVTFGNMLSNDANGGAPRQGGTFWWVRGPPGDPLQPEATGAGMEATKCLKPSDSGSRSGDRANVQAATRVNARACLEKVDVQADPATPSGEG